MRKPIDEKKLAMAFIMIAQEHGESAVTERSGEIDDLKTRVTHLEQVKS